MTIEGNNVNVILLAVIAMAVCWYVAAWLSPKVCRRLSLYFYCRAESLEAAEAARREARAANEHLLEEGLLARRKTEEQMRRRPRRKRTPVAAPDDAGIYQPEEQS